MVDFWRFWVVHLWVEDFLELFTTIMVAYIFVLLGVVRTTTATRVVYLDIILYSIGGVIGTMHHLYFSGAPAVHMALGAFFSAMEVIPLRAADVTRRGASCGSARGRDERSALGASEQRVPAQVGGDVPHRRRLLELPGRRRLRLPDQPARSSATTRSARSSPPTTAHGAMMGVYGMLAIGFFMFVARYFIPPRHAAANAR